MRSLLADPKANRAEVCPVAAYMHAYAIDVAHLWTGEPGADRGLRARIH